jgi:hypothetical protein
MSEFLDQFPELRRARESYGICHYVLLENGGLDLARRILEALPPTRELMFFDPHYPSPSDAGAYISIRQSDGRFVYSFGNHGWSRPWERQSKEFLVSYLALCLPSHRPPASGEHLRLTPISPETLAQSFRNY